MWIPSPAIRSGNLIVHSPCGLQGKKIIPIRHRLNPIPPPIKFIKQYATTIFIANAASRCPLHICFPPSQSWICLVVVVARYLELGPMHGGMGLGSSEYVLCQPHGSLVSSPPNDTGSAHINQDTHFCLLALIIVVHGYSIWSWRQHGKQRHLTGFLRYDMTIYWIWSIKLGALKSINVPHPNQSERLLAFVALGTLFLRDADNLGQLEAETWGSLLWRSEIRQLLTPRDNVRYTDIPIIGLTEDHNMAWTMDRLWGTR